MAETVRDVITRDPRPDGEYRLKVYDFRRPDKFSKDQIRSISLLHETFARLATASLTSMLRSETKVHVSVVDQMTFEEFLKDLVPYPAGIGIVNLDPLRGAGVMQFDNAITFAMIERLYGATGIHSEPARELTELEMTGFEEVLIRLLGCLREGWSPIMNLRPRLGQIETNRAFCQLVPPTEMTVTVTLEIKVGDVESTFNIAYPYIAIEAIAPKLSVTGMFNTRLQGSNQQQNVHVGDLKSTIEIAVEAPSLTIAELVRLRPHDLIPLDAIGQGEGFVLLNGTPVDSCTWDRADDIRHGRFSIDTQDQSAAETDTPRQTPETRETPPAEPDHAATPMETVRDIARDVARELAKEVAEQLSSGFRSVTTKLDEIAGRQDDLTEQIAYSEHADSSLPNETAPQVPFAYIGADDAEWFLPLFGGEHPQTIALILSYLNPRAAALILEQLPGETQPEISERISTTGRITPDLLERIDRSVRKRLESYLKSDFARPSGVQRLVDILNFASRATERDVITALEQKSGDLAEEIKRRMFVFEDIVLLDAKAVSEVMKRADERDVALALRGVENSVRAHIFKSSGPDFAARATKLMAETGPARLSDVERAQTDIVSIIRALEQEGTLHIARADETIL